MPEYKLKFYCEKCEKIFNHAWHNDFKVDTRSLIVETNKLKQKHIKKEHTHCSRCKKKLPDGRGLIKIVGRSKSNLKQREKGIDDLLIYGVFCKQCKKIMDKQGKK